MAAKKSGYDKIKADFPDKNELMGQCKILCDQALIKFYEGKHELIAEYDAVASKFKDLSEKMNKLAKDEAAIIDEWLSNYTQLATVSNTAAHKAGLMKIAIKNKLGDFTGRQKWTYQKVKDLFSGLDITDGFVEAKDVMEKMAAQSADAIVKRLGLAEDEIKKVLKDAKKNTEEVLGVKFDENGAIKKVKKQRPSYRLHVPTILARVKAAENEAEE